MVSKALLETTVYREMNINNFDQLLSNTENYTFLIIYIGVHMYIQGSFELKFKVSSIDLLIQEKQFTPLPLT